MTMIEIAQWRDELEARVLAPGYQTTARDVAESVELVNAYIDELERLEKTATVYRGADIEQITNSILGRWYPNER